MKFTWVLAFAGAAIAAGCGGREAGSSPPSPQPAAPVTAPTKDAGVPETAAPEPKACSEPLAAPQCPTTKPAPTTLADVTAFVKDSAVPLRCDGEGDKPVWDLRPLVDLYGSSKMFMIGEVAAGSSGRVTPAGVERLRHGAAEVLGLRAESTRHPTPFPHAIPDNRAHS